MMNKSASSILLLAIFMSILLVSISSSSFAQATEGEPAIPSNKAPHIRRRSIFQACRKEIERLCVGGEDKGTNERRVAMRKAASCLEEKESQIEDEVCKSWLQARKTCFVDAEKEGVCPQLTGEEMKKKASAVGGGEKEQSFKRGRIMMCLRTVATDKLSEECTNTDFYKAILGLRRFNKQNRMSARREKLNKIAEKMIKDA